MNFLQILKMHFILNIESEERCIVLDNRKLAWLKNEYEMSFKMNKICRIINK